MTPVQIENFARQRYNAVGDSNWSSDEIMGIIWQGCLEISRDCGLVIEKEFSLTTTASLGEYDFPTYAAEIKRVVYDGKKLKCISMREDDVLTAENQITVSTGEPSYYYTWNRVIHLRPIPSSAETLTVFAVGEEEQVTSTSTLDTPAHYHGSLITYCLKEMSAKDLNWAMFDRYNGMWEMEKQKITANIRRSKRSDAFAVVKVEECLPQTVLGVK